MSNSLTALFSAKQIGFFSEFWKYARTYLVIFVCKNRSFTVLVAEKQKLNVIIDSFGTTKTARLKVCEGWKKEDASEPEWHDQTLN